jgi:hypothetical protein
MGMMGKVMGWLFGGGGTLMQTVEAFRENNENGAARQSDEKQAALAQFGAEFQKGHSGIFDRVIDGLNRLPRPMLALGTLGLFVAAMADPVWFSSRMVGVALIPEPLWWLMGAIVSFYFGARYQVKGQDFQRSAAQTVLMAQALAAGRPQEQADPVPVPEGAFTDNAALAEWWGQSRAK